MFKKRKLTISDLIDKKLKQINAENLKTIKNYAILERRITSLINTQFEEAIKTIGYKFTMEKVHDTMFRFYFKNNSYTICNGYIYSLKGLEELSKYMRFKFVSLIPYSKNEEEIEINELAGFLINWIQTSVRNRI